MTFQRFRNRGQRYGTHEHGNMNEIYNECMYKCPLKKHLMILPMNQNMLFHDLSYFSNSFRYFSKKNICLVPNMAEVSSRPTVGATSFPAPPVGPPPPPPEPSDGSEGSESHGTQAPDEEVPFLPQSWFSGKWVYLQYEFPFI